MSKVCLTLDSFQRLTYFLTNLSMETNRWGKFLNIMSQPWWADIKKFIVTNAQVLVPTTEHLFRAFDMTDPKMVRCVILSNRPPLNVAKADGLALSAFMPTERDRTTKAFYEELSRSYGVTAPMTDLSKYPGKGVLLLNVSMSGVDGDYHCSHATVWHPFVRHVLKTLDNDHTFCVIACGRDAQILASECIEKNSDMVIAVAHPAANISSNPFVGSNCLAMCNNLLIERQILPIAWL